MVAAFKVELVKLDELKFKATSLLKIPKTDSTYLLDIAGYVCGTRYYFKWQSVAREKGVVTFYLVLGY